MAIAQGISKITVYKKQAGLGTPASGSGGQTLRRENSVFMMEKDTYGNNEIVSHQQGTGISHGLRKPSGKLNGVISAGTYSALLGSLLRADFAAVTPATGLSLTIAGSGPSYTVTRGAGSYLTDGFKVGDVVRLSAGALNANNINKNLMVTNVTALVLTVRVLNATAMTAEGPIASCTVTVTGKKSKAPLTSHTRDYYTIEEWYSDISRSELYTDIMVGKADIGLPGTGNATIAFDFIGLGRSIGASQILTTPTAETTTAVLNAVNGILMVDGSVVANVTGIQMSIDGTTTSLGAVVGSNSAPDTQRGRVMVTGQFTAYFESGTVSALFENASTTSMAFVIAADNTATSNFVGFRISAMKLSSDSPDDGEKGIVRTFAFEAEINAAGGAALADDKTIISIQDSAA